MLLAHIKFYWPAYTYLCLVIYEGLAGKWGVEEKGPPPPTHTFNNIFLLGQLKVILLREYLQGPSKQMLLFCLILYSSPPSIC